MYGKAIGVILSMTEESFLDKGLVDQFFEEKDFHTMYVVEIEKILVQS